MNTKKFVWDEKKYIANAKKHGITFEEASTVFDDDQALYLDDQTHSQDEERFIVMGYSHLAKLLVVCHWSYAIGRMPLVVCHCYRDQQSVIRIISARKSAYAYSGNRP